MYEFTQTERDRILNSLTYDQREYLKEHMKRGKRTMFARKLAEIKGRMIPDNATDEEIESLNDWNLIDYIDSGFINPETRCMCGRPLRYQYILQHTDHTTNQRTIIELGESHLQEHTGLDAKTVREILKGFRSIDYELDEILHKYLEGWTLEEEQLQIPDGLELPKDIYSHIILQLPLLDRQIRRLRKLIRDYEDQQMRDQYFRTETSNSNNIHVDIFGGSHTEEITLFNFDKTFGIQTQEQQTKHSMDIMKIKGLDTRYHAYVLEKLKSGIRSAVLISEHLLRDYKELDGKNSRYSTGRPRIYADLCIYLDQLVAQGICLLEFANKQDRVYRYIGG